MLDRIVSGRTDLVVEWIEAGGSADARDGSGVSLMQWCAYYGDVSAVKWLLRNRASLKLLGDNLDLNGAAFHGHWQLCQFLIEQGANVNFPLSDTRETPLHAALCKAGRPAYNLVVEVLLNSGANPNAATNPDIETDAFMRDCRTRGETPLHRAAAFGDAEVIERLLRAGAQVDARDAHGETPLGWASWHLRPGRILKLLCYGNHRITEAGASHYGGDHGAGWGGLEASLRGRPLFN